MTTKTTEQKESKEMKTERQEKAKRVNRAFSAQEKCRAVLSVWTERRSPAAVCRELSVKWQQLNQWQNRALEAMLRALDSGRSGERPLLGNRLEKLLEKKAEPGATRLEKRLEMIGRKKGIQSGDDAP